MGTNDLSIKLFNSPKEAPKYSLPEYSAADLTELVVVKNGTVGGGDTVDLIFVDQRGQKHIAMITKRLLLCALGETLSGVSQ